MKYGLCLQSVGLSVGALLFQVQRAMHFSSSVGMGMGSLNTNAVHWVCCKMVATHLWLDIR